MNEGLNGRELRNKGWGRLRELRHGEARVVWGNRNSELRNTGYFTLKTANDEVVLHKEDLQFLLRNV